ncbi:MAG: hypothetical protein KDD22_05580, partial [Bdellovibrionales bacterium]|nr:hypothetical protein [Bdellovibrionales bacterium]
MQENFKATAQILQNLPSDKQKFVAQLMQDWFEESFKTAEYGLLSDSNYSLATFVKALPESRTPESLAALLNSLQLENGSREKMLVHLVEELRSQPEKLERMVEAAEELDQYLQNKRINAHIGARAYNGSIISIDMFALIYSYYNSGVASVEAFERHTGYLTFCILGMASTSFLREILTLRQSAKELVRQWKKRADQRKTAKWLKQVLDELSHDPLAIDAVNQYEYLRSDHSEADIFQSLPLLREAFLEDFDRLLELGKIGETEALRKLAIYDRFVKKLFYHLDPLDRVYLENTFRIGGWDPFFPDHLREILSRDFGDLIEDLEEADITTPPTEAWLRWSERVASDEREHLGLLTQSKRSYYVNILGISLGSALLGVTAAVGADPKLIDQGFMFGLADWVRNHSQSFLVAGGALTVGPWFYQVYEVYKREQERRVVKVSERLKRYTAALNVFRRPWRNETKSCEDLVRLEQYNFS